MSIKAIAWAHDIKTQTSSQKLVLLLLADCHHEKNDRCDPAVLTIAERAIMTERSVRRILGQLEEQGILKREHRDGRSTLYALNWSIRTPDTRVTPTPDTGVTPDTMSPLTPETATPDTSVRDPGHQGPEPLTPVSAEQVEQGVTGKEQVEERASAHPQPPPADDPYGDLPAHMRPPVEITDDVVRIWNDVFAGTRVIVCKGATSSMRMQLRLRIVELRRAGVTNPDSPDYWRRLFQHLRDHGQVFTGAIPRRDGSYWSPRLSWLIDEENLAKAREHTYCEPSCPHRRVQQQAAGGAR